MKQTEVDRFARNLAEKYGLALKTPVRLSSDGQAFSIEPDGLHSNESFRIDVHVGWRSLELQLHLGKFAADLVEGMGQADEEKKQLFATIASEISRLRAVITFTVNSINCNPSDTNTWPSAWRSLDFSIRKSPVEVNTEDHRLTEETVFDWLDRFYAAVISISPLEEIDDLLEVPGLPEGAVARIEVNRYERSRINRSVCLSFHGPTCKVCELNFSNVYGTIGEGFIHVHHVTPVSQLGSDYILNPITDLVPVCPNCHAMLHRRNPPFSTADMKRIIAVVSNANRQTNVQECDATDAP